MSAPPWGREPWSAWTPSDPKVPIVKVKVGKRLKHPKTLAAIKAEPLFKGVAAGHHRQAVGGAADQGAVGLVPGLMLAMLRSWPLADLDLSRPVVKPREIDL
jgi:hypothetical protein